MAKVKIKIVQCPYCNSTQFTTAFQSGYATVTGVERPLSGMKPYHKICLSCGSVVRSYVLDPEKLLKRKNRKYVTD
ncbi:MAG TPA: hypothetical protein PLH98_12210 [Ruminococcus flavefaciens]|nr:hypothetical protein [Ruminococcus flavefaciens]